MVVVVVCVCVWGGVVAGFKPILRSSNLILFLLKWSQFRCGILALRVETGRYVGEKTEERLCKVCQRGQIENELHFVFNCVMYNDFRNDLLSAITQKDSFLLLSVVENLIHLMNNYPRQIAKYLRNAFGKRKQFLYVNN